MEESLTCDMQPVVLREFNSSFSLAFSGLGNRLEMVWEEKERALLLGPFHSVTGVTRKNSFLFSRLNSPAVCAIKMKCNARNHKSLLMSYFSRISLQQISDGAWFILPGTEGTPGCVIIHYSLLWLNKLEATPTVPEWYMAITFFFKKMFKKHKWLSETFFIVYSCQT